MDWKNSKVLLVIVIAVNAVIWPMFIIPSATTVVEDVVKGTNARSANSTRQRMEYKRASVPRETMERIDFNSLRDPFTIGGMPARSDNTEKRVSRPVVNRVVEPVRESPPVQNQDTVERNFTSRFKLKTIVQLRDKYVAGLEEEGAYDAAPADNNPYSYRFGQNPGEQQAQPSAKSYTVYEGDNVLGETVIKIGEDFVIMGRGGLYYRLTFGGGYAVSRP